jgi:hypothetical protein
LFKPKNKNLPSSNDPRNLDLHLDIHLNNHLRAHLDIDAPGLVLRALLNLGIGISGRALIRALLLLVCGRILDLDPDLDLDHFDGDLGLDLADRDLDIEITAEVRHKRRENVIVEKEAETEKDVLEV